jgi:hypothetical protein
VGGCGEREEGEESCDDEEMHGLVAAIVFLVLLG